MEIGTFTTCRSLYGMTWQAAIAQSRYHLTTTVRSIPSKYYYLVSLTVLYSTRYFASKTTETLLAFVQASSLGLGLLKSGLGLAISLVYGELRQLRPAYNDPLWAFMLVLSGAHRLL